MKNAQVLKVTVIFCGVLFFTGLAFSARAGQSGKTAAPLVALENQPAETDAKSISGKDALDEENPKLPENTENAVDPETGAAANLDNPEDDPPQYDPDLPEEEDKNPDLGE
jgi:hypothetical protein